MKTVLELENELRQKMAERPVLGCRVTDATPAQYAKWSEALRAWVFERDELRTAIDIARNVSPTMDPQPKVIKRDYDWTGPDMGYL